MPNAENAFYRFLRSQWRGQPSEKPAPCIGQFYACEHIADRITGKVEGN